MKYFKAFLVVIWRLWMILLAAVYVLTIGLFIVLPLALFERTFPYIYPLARYWGKLIFYGMGFRLDYEDQIGLDPKKNYIFIANHTSLMDIMTVLTVLKHHPIVFVGKAELAKIPVFGRIYRRICILVDRKDLRSRAKVIPDAEAKIKQGLSIFIFPEGGVSDDRSIVLDRFKDGAFTMATETNTAIAVLSICGLKEMFPFNWFEGYPGRVNVKLLAILEPEQSGVKERNRLKEQAYQLIRKDIEQCKK